MFYVENNRETRRLLLLRHSFAATKRVVCVLSEQKKLNPNANEMDEQKRLLPTHWTQHLQATALHMEPGKNAVIVNDADYLVLQCSSIFIIYLF